MKIKKTLSRRNFIKSGLTAAGAGIIGNSPVSGADIEPEIISTPSPIPLNNILVDYLESFFCIYGLYGIRSINSISIQFENSISSFSTFP